MGYEINNKIKIGGIKMENQTTNIQIKPKFTFHPASILLLVLSLVPLGMGLYKMFAYHGADGIYADEAVNSYVNDIGLDMIINTNFSTSFFILFAALFISGFLLENVVRLKK